MIETKPQIAELVGSRICHDLISPIGAINNGMELLTMSGIANSPEMALISESVDAANARIRFFRIAYGTPSNNQVLGRAEVMSILRDMMRGSRTELHWEPAEDLPRAEVQIAFLAIQCAEQAVPYGGRIGLRRFGNMWEITVTSERSVVDRALWDRLSASSNDSSDVMPAHVQFLLLPMAAQAQGRTPELVQTEQGLRLTI